MTVFRILKYSVLAFLICLAQAGDSNSTASEYPIDPYLQYRPPFARSLPVQILLTGVILTLVAVLFIHLMFTAQYHWPLAPVNYVLQLSGVTTLLISLIATIHVVLSATLAESEKWPYMLSYIAVNVPPPLDTDYETDVWSMAERATWMVMNASTSGLIQITHIQFLTLLYPSRLEGRLIFTLLGPLAVVAAIMQLLPISGNDTVNSAASAVRNVCNATLSLLFTLALFIWGLLVNRKQAWRTDGGTAAFGAAALSLALVSTALNFLYVHKEDEFVWLPGLMWAVVLWQSFLGWWWWVGAGSGTGLASADDLEEKLRREAKKEYRKREARERRMETKNKARKVWQGVAGAFSTRDTGHSTSAQSHADSEGGLQIRSSAGNSGGTNSDRANTEFPLSSAAASLTSTLSATSAISFATLPRGFPRFIHNWYASLRREHVAAARQQAAERVERIRELERVSKAPHVPIFGSGWGLGSFGWRIGREERTSRKTSRNSRRSRSISRTKEHTLDPSDLNPEMGASNSWVLSKETDPEDMDIQNVCGPHSRNRENARQEILDQDPNVACPIISPRPPTSPESPSSATLSSVWWWGPLRQWRLKDSTSYS